MFLQEVKEKQMWANQGKDRTNEFMAKKPLNSLP